MEVNGLTIKGVRMKKDECIAVLQDICKELSIRMEENESKGINFDMFKDGYAKCGMIRIYSNAKDHSMTIDGSAKNKEINQYVIDAFVNKHNKDIVVPVKGPGKCAKYDIKLKDFDGIRSIIDNVSSRNGYEVEIKKSLDHIYYMLSVMDSHNGDRAVVTQYNSGVLTIQGKSWNVWDELCNAIDEELNTTVVNLIVRLISKDTQENQEKREIDSAEQQITNIITNSLQSDGEEIISDRLNIAYSFLYEHDKLLIKSSQCMLLAKVNYGDYYCYVAPALRVIDGYLKKVIISLNLRTETEINATDRNGSPSFNYGHIFCGLSHMWPNEKDKLNAGRTSVEDKERALLKIYELYKNTRNPYQHDGPPAVQMIHTYEDAESEIDNIIGVINTTYNTLFL